MPTLKDTIQAARLKAFRFLPNAANVTIRSINAENGNTLVEVSGVLANRTAPHKADASVGDGSVPDDHCRFRTAVPVTAFTVKPRDQVIEASGLVWSVEAVDFVVHGNGLVMDCVLHRS